MDNIFKSYTYNGNFDPELLFVNIWKEIPSKYEFTTKNDKCLLDESKLEFSYIKHLFKESPIQIRYYNSISISSDDEIDDESLDFEDLCNWDFGLGASLCIAVEHMVIRITYCSITIYYSIDDNTQESIHNLILKIYDAIPKKEVEDLTAKVSLVKVYQGDYYTDSADIQEMDINLTENYNDDFLPIHDEIHKFLNNRSSGLVLLYGDAGTGKTSYIRYLCSHVPKEYIVVPNSIACRLGDPDLISFITGHKDSVFILEDCEQLLEDRGENPFNGAISTILNMADGLLSDIVNIKFICTFNAEITKLDPALLRKGRCVAKYEFDKLCADKVKLLNDKYNLGHTEIKDMTLAEVYNPDKIDFTDKKEKKIGF